MVKPSEKVRDTRKKVKKAKAKQRARKLRRRRKAREIKKKAKRAAKPVTDPANAAKDEAQLTRDELGKLRDEVVPTKALQKKADTTQKVTSAATEHAAGAGGAFDTLFGIDSNDDDTIQTSELAYGLDLDGDGQYGSGEVFVPVVAEEESSSKKGNGYSDLLLGSGGGGKKSGSDALDDYLL